MDKHGQLAVLTHIQVHGFEDPAGFALWQSADLHTDRLFIHKQGHVIIAQLLLSLNARRNTVYDRITLIVLLDIHRQHIYRGIIRRRQWGEVSGGINFISVFPPLVTDQFQFTKTHHYRIIKVGHEHPDKTNRFKIRNITHFQLVLFNRNPEQVPFFTAGLPIGQFHITLTDVGDEIRPLAHIRKDIHFILEILLHFIHRIVTVQFFRIRVLGKGIDKLCIVLRHRRVTMRVIDVFITRQNTCNRAIVKRRIPVCFKVVRRRIFQCLGVRDRTRSIYSCQCIQIWPEKALLCSIL